MKLNRLKAVLSGVVVVLVAIACGGSGFTGLGPSVTISIVYGSEKEDWLEALVAQYNTVGHTLESGEKIVVESTPMGSIDSMRQILEGTVTPTIWSPASDLYVPLMNAEWKRTNAEDIAPSGYEELVLSPVVIAMWRPMAEALGWPEEPIGWADIAMLATSDEGWEAYGYPEWGRFKFGHTHPDFSNSGFVSIVAEAYAGAEKQRGLTVEDLRDPDVKEFMAEVESSIIHYGESTGFFGNRMFERGPSYLSAAVLYENLIAAQEQKRIRGESAQIPVVAIYPEEGTFWSNHPYIVLNAPWVTEQQEAAADDFLAFLLAEEQQRTALEYGFRQADPSVPLGPPLTPEYGVDPTQPQTILELPSADVLVESQKLWQEVKKPVDLIVVMDISGSMEGQKISSARTSLMQFITLLDDRDRMGIILFNAEPSVMTELSPLGEKRQDITNRIAGITEWGDTALYDAVLLGYDKMQADGNPDHIRAIVVLSDGEDTFSSATLSDVISSTGDLREGGNAIKIFTIAFGGDADTDILTQIAEITGARMYESTPENINEIYAAIATFF